MASESPFAVLWGTGTCEVRGAIVTRKTHDVGAALGVRCYAESIGYRGAPRNVDFVSWPALLNLATKAVKLPENTFWKAPGVIGKSRALVVPTTYTALSSYPRQSRRQGPYRRPLPAVHGPSQISAVQQRGAGRVQCTHKGRVSASGLRFWWLDRHWPRENRLKSFLQ